MMDLFVLVWVARVAVAEVAVQVVQEARVELVGIAGLLMYLIDYESILRHHVISW